MKSTLATTVTLIAAALLLVSAPASGQHRHLKTAEQTLREIEEMYVNALVKGDAAKLDSIFDDHYVFTNTEGATLDRASHLGRFKSGNYRFASKASIDDVKVRVSGNIAVVTGRLTFVGADTPPPDGQSAYTHVYVKKLGHWRMVANHSHRVGS